MEEQRFDELTRAMARPVPRRTALKLLAGAVLGSVFGVEIGSRSAHAQLPPWTDSWENLMKQKYGGASSAPGSGACVPHSLCYHCVDNQEVPKCGGDCCNEATGACGCAACEKCLFGVCVTCANYNSVDAGYECCNGGTCIPCFQCPAGCSYTDAQGQKFCGCDAGYHCDKDLSGNPVCTQNDKCPPCQTPTADGRFCQFCYQTTGTTCCDSASGACLDCAKCPDACRTVQGPNTFCGCASDETCQNGTCVPNNEPPPQSCSNNHGGVASCPNGGCCQCSEYVPGSTSECIQGTCVGAGSPCLTPDANGLCSSCAGVGKCCAADGTCVEACPDCQDCINGTCVSCASEGKCCNTAGVCVDQAQCSDGCCKNGVCGCPAGTMCDPGTHTCKTTCDPATCNGCCDNGNCVAPGQTCSNGQVCTNGQCLTPCDPCQTMLEGSCVSCATANMCCDSTNTCVSPSSCPGGCCTSGTCGCPTGMACQSGTCVTTCDPSTCTGCCDGTNCVSPGQICSNGQPCANGVCSCGANATQCFPYSDPACCPEGMQCLNGTCAACDSGTHPCDGYNSGCCPDGTTCCLQTAGEADGLYCCPSGSTCTLCSDGSSQQCCTTGTTCC